MLRIGLIVISMFFVLPVFADTASTNTNATNNANSVTSTFGMSFDQLKQEAAKGEPDAEYALGYIYYYGKDGAPQDAQAAKLWIQKAADQGQPQAKKALQLLAQVQTPTSSDQASTVTANATNATNATQSMQSNSSVTAAAPAATAADSNMNGMSAATAATNNAPASDTVNAMDNASGSTADTNAAASAPVNQTANQPSSLNSNSASAQSPANMQANADTAATLAATTANTDSSNAMNTAANTTASENHGNKVMVTKEMPKQMLSAESLLHAPAHYYTVQLYGAFHQHDATHFIQIHRLHGKATYYTTSFNNKPWYVVVYGMYKTDSEAKAAIKGLPSAVQKLNPWIKPLADVQEGMRMKATG
jgi:DamX protein